MPASRRPPAPVVAGVIAVLVVVAVAVGVGVYVRGRPSDLDRFYEVPDGVAAAERGTIFREEPMDATGVDAAAFRVLYRSETSDGAPAAVSGFVAWPLSKPPQGGFPIVAFGHPTSGLTSECAPSREPLGGVLDQAQVTSFLQAGFAVAATDFPGLGSDSIQPYVVGEPSAAAIIDSVRAARASAGDLLSTQVVAWGYSQGGHGVLWARARAAAEAPDLEWRGTVALAPVVDLRYTAETTQLGRVLGVAIGMGQATTGLELDPLLTEQGREVREELTDSCIGKAVEKGVEADTELLTSDRGWLDDAAADDPPAEGSAPALVLYGSEDTVVGTQQVADWVAGAGGDVTGMEVPGASHGGLPEAATAAGDPVLAWMLERVRRPA